MKSLYKAGTVEIDARIGEIWSVLEGNRIDILESKIDLLMTERAEVIALRSEIKKDRAYTEHPLTREKSFLSSNVISGEEERIPLEKIHYDDYHFEVARWDKSKGLTWYEAMNEDYAGDWRLPTINELRLMYLSRERLEMKGMEYWSSSGSSGGFAKYVNFDDGSTDNLGKGSSLSVRLVVTIDDKDEN